MRENVAEVVHTVCRELRLRQSSGAGRTFAGVDVSTVGIRIAVLVAQDAAIPPTLEKPACVDPVLTRAVAIKVVGALPRQNCREMRRPHCRDKPLPRSVIRNAKQPDLAATPRLRARPFNRIVEVTKL